MTMPEKERRNLFSDLRLKRDKKSESICEN
jgi:hypothetical protein